MELNNNLIPFRTGLDKACQGITTNATRTSETPAFEELRVRRFSRSIDEVALFVSEKIDHWIGWFLLQEKKKGNGMLIRAEVSSVILFGMKISLTIGLYEEKDHSGEALTTVHAKAETQIESKGDLGESRRAIRMILGALDFNFRNHQLTDETYRECSTDSMHHAQEATKIFDQPEKEQHPKPAAIKKRAPVQTIQLRSSSKSEQAVVEETPRQRENDPVSNEQNATTSRQEITVSKPSKPKITIVTTKKKL